MDEMFSYIPLVSTILVFKMCVLSVDSYDLQCPSQSNWKFRAKVKCNSTSTYFCLFNNVNGNYVEGCDGPDWDRKGSKRIFVGDFSRENCVKKRFQPIKFWTNESMSDCIYAKSICSEDGQVVYIDDSTKDDRTCRCDYKKNYSFKITPRNLCYCIPTEEDCSCYIKSCPVNFTLSADYKCGISIYEENPKCEEHVEITKYNDTTDKTSRVNMAKDQLWIRKKSSKPRWNETFGAVVLFFLLAIIVSAGSAFAVIFTSWTCVTFQSEFKVSKQPDHDDSEASPPIKFTARTEEEVNFLRIIHLLFRVACPVVRMVFDHEIKPDLLRKTLDKRKVDMERLYRKKDPIISDSQWDLLYKEKKVTSENFDISLMTYLLRTLADIAVGDLYPVKSDTSKIAMLSRISYIRNDAAQNFEGKLPEKKFREYWDDIGQAVLNLVSLYTHDIERDENVGRLNGKLLKLNPIDIDHGTLCTFIDMSEKYPAMILKQLISEYCIKEKLEIKDILRTEKHSLYHRRIKSTACCICTIEFSTFTRLIPEKQWNALYEVNKCDNSHVCLKNCSEVFVPKDIDISDLSVSVSIILYIPNILKYVIQRLCGQDFYRFLSKHRHTIFHSMQKTKCCMCKQGHIPTEKTVMRKEEWDKLYAKLNNKSCKEKIIDCCCQYAARKQTRYLSMDEVFWSKLFYIAGPVSVLYQTRQDAFVYFVNWIIDKQPLQMVLTELLKAVNDVKFRHDMEQLISSSNQSQLNKTAGENNGVNDDAREWISRHVQDSKKNMESQLQIIVRNDGALNVKCLQIPQNFDLPDRTRECDDPTTEENNYLVVVYGLSKIVYPVIKNEFNTQCPEHVLSEIRKCIFEQYGENSNKQENKSKIKINLTRKQREQLDSMEKKESEIIDLELMIYILKQRCNPEFSKIYIAKLDIIDDIRTQIIQSSNGILDKTTFQDILRKMSTVVWALRKDMYKEELSSLHLISNILE